MTEDEWMEVELQREGTHQLIHSMPQDFDTTVNIAVTLRDLLLLGLFLDCGLFIYPCLRGESQEFQKRILELTRAQQPDWTTQGELPEDYGSEGS